MVDQVNPLGSLAPGLPPTSQALASAATRAPSVQESTSNPSPSQSAVPAGSGGKGAPIPGKVPEQALGAAARDMQDYLQQLPTDLQFRVDKGSGQFYFKVVDPATHKVIRQVPSEEVLAMARKLRQFADPKSASGVLLDQEG